jgi:Cof subfamily protein (haloacid dehalogenase superfamily)
VTPKAIFLDIDGTYLNGRGLVPDSASAAVRAARDNGHQVFLCTGRAIAQIWDHITEAGFDGVIASSGAYVEYRGATLFHRSLPRPVVEHVVAFLGDHGIDFFLEANSGLYGTAETRQRIMSAVYGDEADPAVVADLSVGFGQFIERFVVDQSLIRDDINKVSFLGSSMPIDRIRAEFSGELDIVPGTVAKFGANSGEMSLPGIHKATAIELVLAHLGIARKDTIAFGDSTNDIEMIQFVATGVAMADADPDVLTVSDMITPTAAEDGLAHALRVLGLIAEGP